MNIDYSLLLFVLVVISGLIWLYDAAVAARIRNKSLREFMDGNGISEEELDRFMLEYGRDKDAKSGLSKQREALLHQAARMRQEPTLVEYSKSFFPILFAVLFFRAFLFEPFQIPTASMVPTLNVGDYIVVNKYAYGIRLPVIGTEIIDMNEPERGDVMVFVPPHDPNYFVKRVVGLPGDHVRYEDKTVYINGKPMTQEFIELRDEQSPPVIYAREQLGDVEHDIYLETSSAVFRSSFWLASEGRTVPEGHYFMMGDNRDNSDDSRRWGVVPEENIVGKAVAVWMHKEPGLSLPTFSQNRLINTE